LRKKINGRTGKTGPWGGDLSIRVSDTRGGEGLRKDERWSEKTVLERSLPGGQHSGKNTPDKPRDEQDISIRPHRTAGFLGGQKSSSPLTKKTMSAGGRPMDGKAGRPG